VALFVDTSALYALVDESDAAHDRVREIYEPRAADLVSTDYVLVESWLLVRARFGVAIARRFWNGMRNGPISLVGITADDLERAWVIDSGSWRDQGFGLVDATSFAVIERLGVSEALSLDRHFRTVRIGRRGTALKVWP
jgi:predicted nucleic acid-binding protein